MRILAVYGKESRTVTHRLRGPLRLLSDLGVSTGWCTEDRLASVHIPWYDLAYVSDITEATAERLRQANIPMVLDCDGTPESLLGIPRVICSTDLLAQRLKDRVSMAITLPTLVDPRIWPTVPRVTPEPTIAVTTRESEILQDQLHWFIQKYGAHVVCFGEDPGHVANAEGGDFRVADIGLVIHQDPYAYPTSVIEYGLAHAAVIGNVDFIRGRGRLVHEPDEYIEALIDYFERPYQRLQDAGVLNRYVEHSCNIGKYAHRYIRVFNECLKVPQGVLSA